jgi:hypothetical protein
VEDLDGYLLPRRVGSEVNYAESSMRGDLLDPIGAYHRSASKLDAMPSSLDAGERIFRFGARREHHGGG